MGLKALSSTIQNSDISQLQQMLGSSNDAEALKKHLIDEHGQYKWGWLNQVPKVSVLDKLTQLTPLASAGRPWRLMKSHWICWRRLRPNYWNPLSRLKAA